MSLGFSIGATIGTVIALSGAILSISTGFTPLVAGLAMTGGGFMHYF